MPDKPRSPKGSSTLGFLFGVCEAAALPGPILVELMTRVGLTETAARQLLVRLRSSGGLESTRSGRVSVYRLAGSLLTNFERIHRRTIPDAAPWQGSFHLVLYDVPERERSTRDRLRAAAFAAGFAALRPGVMIGCSSPEPWLTPFLGPPGSPVLVEHGVLTVDLEAAKRIARQAWELDRHIVRTRAATEAIRSTLAPPITPADGWRSLRRLHDAFATAAPVWVSTPKLPDEVLPDDWPLAGLGRAIYETAANHSEPVQQVLGARLDEHPYAQYVTRLAPVSPCP